MKPKIIKISTIILTFLFLVAACHKDDTLCPCSTEKSFSVPNWINDLQTQLENNSKICFADMTLFEWDSSYYIQLRTAVDSAYDPPNVIYDCEGNIVKECDGYPCVENCEDFKGEANELQTIWAYNNASCFCSTDQEFTEPEWLTEQINNLDNNSEIISGEINLYAWKNKYYISVRIFTDAYDLPIEIYDCEGNLIYKVSVFSTCGAVILQKSQKIKTLWNK